jgi:hypothetical protein
MNLIEKMSRNLGALAMAPLVSLERKERERRLEERYKRIKKKEP